MQLVCAAELEQEGTAGLRPNLQVGKEKNLGKNPTPAVQSHGEPGQRLPEPSGSTSGTGRDTRHKASPPTAPGWAQKEKSLICKVSKEAEKTRKDLPSTDRLPKCPLARGLATT